MSYSSLAIFSAYFLARLKELSKVECQTAATIAALCVSLWILAVLARPYNRWKLALLGAMAAIAVAAIVIPPVRDFFELSVPLSFLPQALAIGAVGAVGIDHRPAVPPVGRPHPAVASAHHAPSAALAGRCCVRRGGGRLGPLRGAAAQGRGPCRAGEFGRESDTATVARSAFRKDVHSMVLYSVLTVASAVGAFLDRGSTWLFALVLIPVMVSVIYGRDPSVTRASPRAASNWSDGRRRS